MIKNTKLIIPKDPKEQQRIANTLSSLDNLIEAQTKKVAAFKKHKKGLMQQMFVSGEE
jgi:type I restriction enzyme S subunit